MKKFLAVVFALIFALSAATTAFAVANTCPHCGQYIETEKAFNEHLDKTCPVLHPVKPCPYEGCGAKFQDEEQYEIHVAKCPKKSDKDKFIEKIKGIDYKAIVTKVIGVVQKIDFPAIIAKILPVIEKAVKAIVGAVKSM